MKLNQLGLTPAGQKATAKLGKQVHKTTVAAAMEPKLKLGVVGIEIGQEQAKGATSIAESAEALHRFFTESSKPSSNWSTISSLAKMLDIKWTWPKDSDFDRDEVANDAIEILKLSQSQRSQAGIVQTAIVQMADGIHTPRLQQTKGSAEALLQLAPNLTPWMKKTAELAIELAQKAPAAQAHARAVSYMVSVLRVVLESAQTNKQTNWSPHYKFILAAFKKMGVI